MDSVYVRIRTKRSVHDRTCVCLLCCWSMAQLETIPGQKGYLVISTDGAVVQSGGELQNDEHTADLMLRLVKNGQKLVNSLSPDRKTSMHRLSVCYKNHTLVASVWNHRIHVVKRLNPET